MAKRERTEIIVNERYKVVRVDSLNWQVYEYREVKENGNTSRAGERDWMALPAFFGCVEFALEWIARAEVDDCGLQMTLEEAVKEIKASNAKLAREIKKALASG